MRVRAGWVGLGLGEWVSVAFVLGERDLDRVNVWGECICGGYRWRVRFGMVEWVCSVLVSRGRRVVPVVGVSVGRGQCSNNNNELEGNTHTFGENSTPPLAIFTIKLPQDLYKKIVKRNYDCRHKYIPIIFPFMMYIYIMVGYVNIENTFLRLSSIYMMTPIIFVHI